MIPRVGQKIGPYEILGRLGSGGMGLVFSAWDARLHRDVAIKLLKDEFLNPTMRSRFLGEARAASRLNHPNICTIFDIGEEQDSPYMVMELLKGETLRGRMQQGSMPVEQILQVATEVADALSVAHAQGIVHRDIKPANVVLVDKPSGAFQTKVLDFGLAKFDTGADVHSGLTTTGMTVGTVSYMSPEQARGELLDGRSDLFALGVLLYEMATGRLPFDGATSALIFVQLLNHPPEPLRSLNASVPRAFEQVINTCLQKNRNERYQTAQELVIALHKAAQNLSGSERTASWFSKFTNGLKRESEVQEVPPVEEREAGSPETTPLQLSADEAFLKPFKPNRRPTSSTVHYQPVNSPYSDAEKEVPESNQDGESTSPEPPLSGIDKHAESVPAVHDDSSSIAHVSNIAWIDEPIEAPPLDEQQEPEEEHADWRGSRILLGSLLALAILIISTAVFLSKRKAMVARRVPVTTIAAIANHTGDSTLGHLLATGLELSLQQSPVIGLRNSSNNRASSTGELPRKNEPAFVAFQRSAESSGAATFVLGEAHMEGQAYSMSFHLYDAATGAVLGESASVASSRERILGAIDSLAITLRSTLGESGLSIHETSLPLSKMSTANVDALLAFNLGEGLEASNRIFDAISAFERAAQLDPQFTQAHFRLAELYSWQHAELAAAKAADQAQATANGDEHTRLLVSGLQAMLATGDLGKASGAFSEATRKYSLDPLAFALLARSARQQGDFKQALSASQQAVRLAPSNVLAAHEQAMSLLGLDQLQPTDAALDASHPTGRAMQLLRFLRGAMAEAPTDMQMMDDLDAEITHAQILDASGRFEEGLVQWRSVAQRAVSSPSLSSTAAYALAQGSLDRALAGDCATAFALEQQAGSYPMSATVMFSLGMSSGLCGNVPDARARLSALTTTYPQATSVTGFYTSDLNALLQWKAGSFADALVTLQSASQYDAISFNSYLRGQTYLAQKQPQPATVELQSALRHPGAIVSITPEALPMTYLTLARAFVVNGDSGNAVQSYQKLSNIFQHADSSNPVAVEAKLAAAR